MYVFTKYALICVPYMRFLICVSSHASMYTSLYVCPDMCVLICVSLYVAKCQVDNDLLSGVPNPLGEIMKVVPAREQELAQVEGPARTQALR